MSLKDLTPLKDFMPSIYRDVKEMEALIQSEDYLFDILVSIIDTEYARMFIQTSDLKGVEKFESILKITAEPAIETLEFRKERLLSRCNSTLPYTTIWLRVFLNSILGEHNYELDIDYKDNIIRLYGHLVNYSWSKEATRVIQNTKPCNMIFINIPTMIDNIGLMYWNDSNTWNSNKWNDSNTYEETKYLESQELIDYRQINSSSPDFNLIYEKIKLIKINNQLKLKNPRKTIENDTMYIEFTVPDIINTVELVEVIDDSDKVLTSNECYIDTPRGTVIVLRLVLYRNKGE